MKIKLSTYKSISFPGLLPRRVDIWFPPQYELEESRSFPVLYMHDGQNLFRRNKFILSTWKVAEHITELSYKSIIPPVVVVGIWNTSNRMGDYLPQKPLASVKAQMELKHFSERFHFNVGDQVSDLYLKLIVEKIKPMVDQSFRTLPERDQTGIMGSSMGGLISLYALTEYPDIFGMAGCISTHWPICGEYLVPYLDASLPKPGKHRIYFDHGTRRLDRLYDPYQKKVDNLMQEKGYLRDKDWVSKVFRGDDHNEICWSNRLNIPLEFLFSGKGQAKMFETDLVND